MTVEYPAYADDRYWSDHTEKIGYVGPHAWSQEDRREPMFGMEGRWDIEHPTVLLPLVTPRVPFLATVYPSFVAVAVAVLPLVMVIEVIVALLAVVMGYW